MQQLLQPLLPSRPSYPLDMGGKGTPLAPRLTMGGMSRPILLMAFITHLLRIAVLTLNCPYHPRSPYRHSFSRVGV